MGWHVKRPEGARPIPHGRRKHDLQSLLDRALLLMYAKRFREADELLARVKQRWPTEPRVHIHEASRGLLAEDYSPATWRHYEALRYIPGRDKLQIIRAPYWDGTPGPGQTLFVHGEGSGLGDWIQLIRLASATKAQFGGTVALGLPPGLTPLFADVPGIDFCAEPPYPNGYDLQIPLAELAAHVPLTQAIMRRNPYLFPTPEARERWAPMFADRGPLHVGLSWAAAKDHYSGPHRTLTLANLAPVFDVPGTTFYSLQYGAQEEVAKYPQITNLGHIDSPQARFKETIGVLAHLDLLIAADSSVGHLAGSVGTPTWLMLPFAYDPQWGAKRPTTRWYPGHTLFYCQAPPAKSVLRSQRAGLDEDPWPEVVEEVKATLAVVKDNRALLRA